MSKKTKGKTEPTPGTADTNQEETAIADRPTDVPQTALTLSALEKLLGGRRKLSSDEKTKLLDQINVLRVGPLNVQESAQALLGVCESGVFACCGGDWPDFFQRALGWPAEVGLRILNLYKEGRWAEVESSSPISKPAPAKRKGKGSRKANSSEQAQREARTAAPCTSAPTSQTGCSDSGERLTDSSADRSHESKAEEHHSATGEESVPIGSDDPKPAPVEKPSVDGAVSLSPSEVVLPLSKKEKARLSEYEAIITEHGQAIFQMAEALRAIRDGKLYREDFGTFEEYCRKRWNFSRKWAYAQLKCADVRENLSTMVDRANIPEPANERQLRPLASLDPEQQRTAWKRAAEIAHGKAITNTHVQKAVKELFGMSQSNQSATEFDRDATWNKLEALLLRYVKVWPVDSKAILCERLQQFMTVNLNVNRASASS